MYKPDDYVKQLADHIEKNILKGYTLDSLRVSLTSQGYSRISIEKAIAITNKKLASKIPKMKEKPQITRRIIYDNDKIYDDIFKNQ